MRMIVACGFLVVVAFGIRVTAAQVKVSNFGLKNQNDQYTEVNFPSDRPVLLIFGDRKGSGQINGWSQPVYAKYSNKVYIFGIASLSGVPSYARGMVRRLIKRQTSYPVLLDWGGTVAGGLGYEKNMALVVLVEPDGTVARKWSGAATNAEIQALNAEIDKLL